MNAYPEDEYEVVFRRVRVLDENGLPHWIEVPSRESLALAA